MKKLLLTFSNGFKTSFSFNGDLQSLQIVDDGESRVEHEIRKIDETNPQQVMYYFVGLWYTSIGMFVEVVSINEAYVINEKGERYSHTTINDEGYSDIAGFIQTTRRGDEEYVNRTNIRWPKLKGNTLKETS